MRLYDLINEEIIDEVSMSPGALQDFAKSSFAETVRAGFEAELIVPSMFDPEGGEAEPDFNQDERVHGSQGIIDFFVGEYNTRRTVERAIEQMGEEFFEAAYEAFDQDDDMQDQVKEKARQDMLDDGYSKEDIDLIEQGEGSPDDQKKWDKFYEYADESVRDYFMQDYYETWIRQHYSHMSDVSNAFGLDWPYWTSGGEGEGEVDVDALKVFAQELENAVDMKVKYSTSYHGASRDDKHFIIEPDSSIGADSSEGEAGIEIVSPPMFLADCMTALDRVFAFAKDNDCRTDKSTGFHMGISIPGQNMSNIDHMKFIMFLGDEYVLSQFNRSSNTYARSMVKAMKEKAQNSRIEPKEILDSFKEGLNSSAAKLVKSVLTKTNTRYVSVNIKENYIEVRSAGGNYLGDLSKIKNTLLRYVRAMGLAADPEAEKQEYAKKIYKFLSPMVQGDDDTIKYFAQFSAGILPATILKSSLRQAQSKRMSKQIPDIITINQPKKNDYAFLVHYLIQGNITKKLRVYGSGRTDALTKAHDYLGKDNVIVGIYADIHDPTNQTRQAPATQAQASTQEAQTYTVVYLPPNGNEAQTAFFNANSHQEAIDYFRSTHPASYEIQSIIP